MKTANITKEYLERSPLLYKYVFFSHRGFQLIWDVKDTAHLYGYPFFMHEGVVYHSTGGKVLTIEEYLEWLVTYR
jgi:hypothetical protein